MTKRTTPTSNIQGTTEDTMQTHTTLTKLIRNAQVPPEGERALLAQAAMEKTWEDYRLAVDLAKAGAVAVDTAKKLRTIGAELEAAGYGPDQIDALEQAGHAAIAANLISKKGKEPMPDLVAEALARRQGLVDLVAWLEGGTLLPEGALAGLGVTRRRATVADDLARLAGLCERHRPTIEPKLYTTWDDIDWVNANYTRLNAALASAEPTDEELQEVKALRVRAGSILVAAHRRARAVVAYVVPNKAEAAALAPTIFVRRPPVKKAQTEAGGQKSPEVAADAKAGEAHVAAPDAKGAPKAPAPDAKGAAPVHA